jgi:hypothetical protein
MLSSVQFTTTCVLAPYGYLHARHHSLVLAILIITGSSPHSTRHAFVISLTYVYIYLIIHHTFDIAFTNENEQSGGVGW